MRTTLEGKQLEIEGLRYWAGVGDRFQSGRGPVLRIVNLPRIGLSIYQGVDRDGSVLD